MMTTVSAMTEIVTELHKVVKTIEKDRKASDVYKRQIINTSNEGKRYESNNDIKLRTIRRVSRSEW